MPLFQPIKSNIKTNGDLLANVFSPLARSATDEFALNTDWFDRLLRFAKEITLVFGGERYRK